MQIRVSTKSSISQLFYHFDGVAFTFTVVRGRPLFDGSLFFFCPEVLVCPTYIYVHLLLSLLQRASLLARVCCGFGIACVGMALHCPIAWRYLLSRVAASVPCSLLPQAGLASPEGRNNRRRQCCSVGGRSKSVKR